ncbi:MAG TPA: DUF222 domain-containing protein, partial [Kribbella sp.]|nr:DUF222 domain-containing protein [Kribbella sp.]
NHELLPALDDVDAEINRLKGIRLQLVARVEESGHAQELGARDAVDLLAFRHRRDRTDVHREVRLARTLPKYAAVGNALTNGIELPDQSADGAVRPMRTAHAAAIVSELERVRARVPVEDLDVAEEQLVNLAAHLAPKELRAAAKEICNLLDTDGLEPAQQKAYERETLTLTTAENGVKFKGFLANENAELLRSVIHAGARPHKTIDGEHDPRPRDKRQADALTTALTLAADAWDTNNPTTARASAPDPTAEPGDGSGAGHGDRSGTGSGGTAARDCGRRVPGHGAKANITVTIDFEDLKAATANAVGQTVYSDNLSAATIRRLACDANVIPLVLGSNSEPLDVGRRERLVTKAMRQALNARDRGCVVCGAPPVMCDAHHVVSWIDGGATAINNLALVCRRDHVDIHHDRWHITITNGKVHVARPSWADPPPLRLHRSNDGVRLAPARPGEEPVRPAPAPVDPWGGTGLPAVSSIGARSGRWKADAAKLAEAARFAVWGDTSTGPPSFATV